MHLLFQREGIFQLTARTKSYISPVFQIPTFQCCKPSVSAVSFLHKDVQYLGSITHFNTSVVFLLLLLLSFLSRSYKLCKFPTLLLIKHVETRSCPALHERKIWRHTIEIFPYLGIRCIKIFALPQDYETVAQLEVNIFPKGTET